MSTESEILKFVSIIARWQVQVLRIEGMKDAEAKEEINRWLNQFELDFRNGMSNVNRSAGFDGFKESANFNELLVSQAVYQETYGASVQAFTTTDLNQARRLRNILAIHMRERFNEFKEEIDTFFAEGVEAGFSQQQLVKGFAQTKAFSDNVFLMDSAGRKWQPNHYASMYSRTRSSMQSDDILFEDLVANDIDIVKISDTPTTTPICQKHVGKYYSLSGNTPELEMIEFRPPFHPNCVHTMIPVNITGEKAAEINKGHPGITEDLTKGQEKSLTKQEDYLLANRPNPLGEVAA